MVKEFFYAERSIMKKLYGIGTGPGATGGQGLYIINTRKKVGEYR